MSSHQMPLMLVRHAVAEETHRLGDAFRALTPEGRAAFRTHARKLARLTPMVGIATSPLVRCVQTAELLAEAFGLSRVEVHGELRPRPHAHRRLLHLGRELGAGWMLVGHNPSLTRAGLRALEWDVLPGKMRKGAVLALHPQGKHFSLAWMAAPGRALLRPDAPSSR